jgi:hypothetical protein
MASSTQWRVDFAIPSGSDITAFERYVAPRGPDRARTTVRRSQEPDSGVDAIFSVELGGFDALYVQEFGVLLFDEACDAAGVSDHPGAVLIGVVPPATDSAVRATYLLAEAHELEMTDHPAAAVLMVHAAYEMLVRGAIADQLRSRLGAERADAALRSWRSGLSDKRSRNALHALLGLDVTATTWWPAFQAHVARRNAIAHEGLEVTESLAAESRQAVQACITWLEGVSLPR